MKWEERDIINTFTMVHDSLCPHINFAYSKIYFKQKS